MTDNASLSGTQPLGAQRLRRDLDRVSAELSTAADELAGLLAQRGRQRDARVARLLHALHHQVHDGYRLLGDIGRLRRADEAAAGDDPLAQAVQRRAWTALNLSLNTLRLNLTGWPPVEHLVRRQLQRRRLPLYEDYAELPETAQIRERVSDTLFAQLHHLLNRVAQDKAADDHGCFPDIPLAHSLFLREVHAAKRCLHVLAPGRETRFLDVGCGAGLKVISAAPFFDRCVGLEYDPGYARLASDLFGDMPHDRCRVVQGDALTWDGYDDYDVIYFFRPIRDDARLARMERHIVDSIPGNTLLIAPYRTFDARAEGYGCARLAGDVYLSGASAAEAAAVLAEAEKAGADLRHSTDPNIPLLWDRVVLASRAQGFEKHPETMRPIFGRLRDRNS